MFFCFRFFFSNRISEIHEGDEGSTLIAWKSACEAIQRVSEDPTSHSAIQQARQQLLTTTAIADMEQTNTLKWQGRFRLRVRYELAALKFEEVMLGDVSADGLVEELLQILALLRYAA